MGKRPSIFARAFPGEAFHAALLSTYPQLATTNAKPPAECGGNLEPTHWCTGLRLESSTPPWFVLPALLTTRWQECNLMLFL